MDKSGISITCHLCMKRDWFCYPKNRALDRLIDGLGDWVSVCVRGKSVRWFCVPCVNKRLLE